MTAADRIQFTMQAIKSLILISCCTSYSQLQLLLLPRQLQVFCGSPFVGRDRAQKYLEIRAAIAVTEYVWSAYDL